MEAGLSDAQQRVLASAREFALGELAPSAAAREAAGEFPYGVLNRLADLGLMGIPFPQEYGGAGLDERTLDLVIAELAVADPAVAITVAAHTRLGAMPVHLWGSDEQRAYWMPQLCSGSRLASLAFGDPLGEGAATPAARLESGFWTLSGSNRTAISSGSVGFACLIVAASTSAPGEEAETSLFIVPAETPGLAPQEEVAIGGFGAADACPVSLNGCRVPEANLLGERGRGGEALRGLLEGSPVGAAAIALSAAQAAVGPARSAESERARALLIGAAEAPSPAPEQDLPAPEPAPEPIPPTPAPVPPAPEPPPPAPEPIPPAPAAAAAAPQPTRRPPAPEPGPKPWPAARGRRSSRKPMIGRLPSDRAVALAGAATGVLAAVLLIAGWQL